MKSVDKIYTETKIEMLSLEIEKLVLNYTKGQITKNYTMERITTLVNEIEEQKKEL